MQGGVVECEACGKQARWGYSNLALDFAERVRGRDADRNELIDEFFESNPQILREQPSKCPSCGSEKIRTVHEYQ